MTKSNPVVVHAAVEGLIDEAVLRRLVVDAGATPGIIFGKEGKSFIKKRIGGYNRAAESSPWVVLVDLDHEAGCPPDMKDSWLPDPASYMCFRIAVREIEAWLLADSERLARFLGVKISRIPPEPEALDDPKRTMVRLASGSRRRDIKHDLVPRPRSRRSVGPAYNARLIQFVSNLRKGWRPEIAAQSADSLNRCIRKLEDVVREYA